VCYYAGNSIKELKKFLGADQYALLFEPTFVKTNKLRFFKLTYSGILLRGC